MIEIKRHPFCVRASLSVSCVSLPFLVWRTYFSTMSTLCFFPERTSDIHDFFGVNVGAQSHPDQIWNRSGVVPPAHDAFLTAVPVVSPQAKMLHGDLDNLVVMRGISEFLDATRSRPTKEGQLLQTTINSFGTTLLVMISSQRGSCCFAHRRANYFVLRGPPWFFRVIRTTTWHPHLGLK